MKVMLKILLYLWQLPQNIVGLIMLWVLMPTSLINKYGHTVVRKSKKMRGGISLGNYIFMQEYSSKKTELHEVGHAKQSLMLGPLYLIVIGLPSLLWAALHKYIAPRKSYYWFYTEKWANNLMGLNIK